LVKEKITQDFYDYFYPCCRYTRKAIIKRKLFYRLQIVIFTDKATFFKKFS